MAHFAELDESDRVVRVIVVHNDDLLDDGVESEAKGIAFCQAHYGKKTRWVQTSYNGSVRKNYAGVGYQYDVNRDGFIPPPHPEFSADQVLDEETLRWKFPKEQPADAATKDYDWDPVKKDWVAVEDTKGDGATKP